MEGRICGRDAMLRGRFVEGTLCGREDLWKRRFVEETLCVVDALWEGRLCGRDAMLRGRFLEGMFLRALFLSTPGHAIFLIKQCLTILLYVYLCVCLTSFYLFVSVCFCRFKYCISCFK